MPPLEGPSHTCTQQPHTHRTDPCTSAAPPPAEQPAVQSKESECSSQGGAATDWRGCPAPTDHRPSCHDGRSARRACAYGRVASRWQPAGQCGAVDCATAHCAVTALARTHAHIHTCRPNESKPVAPAQHCLHLVCVSYKQYYREPIAKDWVLSCTHKPQTARCKSRPMCRITAMSPVQVVLASQPHAERQRKHAKRCSCSSGACLVNVHAVPCRANTQHTTVLTHTGSLLA